MVKINPNNISALNLRKTAEMKNTEETKIQTKTYEPTAPKPDDLVDLDEGTTPT